jgi:hypothetical protein
VHTGVEILRHLQKNTFAFESGDFTPAVFLPQCRAHLHFVQQRQGWHVDTFLHERHRFIRTGSGKYSFSRTPVSKYRIRAVPT